MKLALALVWSALLLASPASAHEMGTSQASAEFRDSTFQVDIVVDPDTLLSKLEAFGGRPVSHGLSRTERDDRSTVLATRAGELERLLDQVLASDRRLR